MNPHWHLRFGRGGTMKGVFVAVVGAIFDAIALMRFGDAPAAFALELVLAAALIGAGVGFVRLVAAVVFSVAGERHPDAVIIGALVLVGLTGQRSAALVRVLVTGSLAAAICQIQKRHTSDEKGIGASIHPEGQVTKKIWGEAERSSPGMAYHCRRRRARWWGCTGPCCCT